jgi:hypothetical protein
MTYKGVAPRAGESITFGDQPCSWVTRADPPY